MEAIVPFDLAQAAATVESALLLPDTATTAYPVLIIMSGLPGSGKSYLSQRVAQQLPAVVIQSDQVRKVLFPHPDYSAEESATVHRVCREVLGRLLRRGKRVVFDATNLVEFQREILYSLAEHCGAGLLIVRTVAPEEMIRKRLEQRRTNGAELSDADWSVYRRMLKSEQQIRRAHLNVDTTQPVDEVVRKIVRAARRCSTVSL